MLIVKYTGKMIQFKLKMLNSWNVIYGHTLKAEVTDYIQVMKTSDQE